MSAEQTKTAAAAPADRVAALPVRYCGTPGCGRNYAAFLACGRDDCRLITLREPETLERWR